MKRQRNKERVATARQGAQNHLFEIILFIGCKFSPNTIYIEHLAGVGIAVRFLGLRLAACEFWDVA